MGDYPSKSKVNRAGFALERSDPNCEEYRSALITANRWREMHIEPLRLLLDETSILASRIPGILVAGRIKKLDTIIDKLKRPNTPAKLATMYDIAGCRVVVNDINELDVVCSIMRESLLCDLEKSSSRDYVASPKASGYRGRHLIFSFYLDNGPRLFAELQLRTTLQHSWATAVEMYDLAADSSRLKFNELDTPAGRFFRLASKVIERIEHGSDELCGLRDEMSNIEDRYGILSLLESAQMSLSVISGETALQEGSYCLVDQDIFEQSLVVTQLDESNAAQDYFAREQEAEEGHSLVLVCAGSMGEIERMYPNYFGNISVFTQTMRSLLG